MKNGESTVMIKRKNYKHNRKERGQKLDDPKESMTRMVKEDNEKVKRPLR